MAINLPPVPQHAEMLDQRGLPTQIWTDWFRKVFLRAGGNIASSNTELAALFPVTTANITDSAVTTAKINNLAVTTAKIDDLAVTTAKLAAEAVSFAKLLGTDWTSSKVASGYQKLPNGLYIQWGVTGSFATATSTSVSFPLAFPTGCLQVICGVRDNSAIATTSTGQWGTGGYSTTAFSLYNRTSVSLTFNWIAVGY